jgi:hypothetical protein
MADRTARRICLRCGALFVGLIGVGTREDVMDRKRVSKIILAVFLTSGLQLYAQQSVADAPAKAGSISTFDVPGSTCLAQFFA